LEYGKCRSEYEVRGGIPIIRENHSFYYGLTRRFGRNQGAAGVAFAVSPPDH
jgi:hypothetical protein